MDDRASVQGIRKQNDEGKTMKYSIMTALILLTSCTHKPVVDLRASKEQAQVFQRDLMECEVLAKQITGNAISRVLFTGYRQAMNNCIRGRGHSVLNDW